jgi:hypothetical protein
MIHSSPRKLILSGWLKQNGNTEYESLLKLQKFLLFYELFAKINGKTADFNHLKGCKYGPVFSDVWEDYTHERLAFDAAVKKEYSVSHEQVVEEYAKKSQFLVSVLSENELSVLTNRLNIWKSRETQILQGESQVELQESDFNDDDAKLMVSLETMYPMSLIDNSHIIEIDNHYFVFGKQDAGRLSEKHLDILRELSDKEQLSNPVYVELDEEGTLIVD